jgi:hypothetical protein
MGCRWGSRPLTGTTAPGCGGGRTPGSVRKELPGGGEAHGSWRRVPEEVRWHRQCQDAVWPVGGEWDFHTGWSLCLAGARIPRAGPLLCTYETYLLITDE